MEGGAFRSHLKLHVFVVCSLLYCLVCSSSCTVFQDVSPPLAALLPGESAVCRAGESQGRCEEGGQYEESIFDKNISLLLLSFTYCTRLMCECGKHYNMHKCKYGSNKASNLHSQLN